MKALRPWTVPKSGWRLVDRVVMTTLGLDITTQNDKSAKSLI